MTRPDREIRAYYDQETIRVYQAYSNEIADSAVKHQTFVSPPFSMNRMTWIKPSFLWMMYRAGWGYKDAGQQRILAIDITNDGFAWALTNSCPSHPETGMSHDEWRDLMQNRPVRVQWDPERDLHHAALPYRSIQIGLSGEAVRLYTSQWINRVTDVTQMAHEICNDVRSGSLQLATQKLPQEATYAPNLADLPNWLR